MARILIITVNYKAPASTDAFLRSASQMSGFAATHVVVTDNASNDGSAEALRPLVRAFNNVELVESSLNRGYFGAAKWALETYAARNAWPDWVIVCNNDISFPDPQFFVRLLDRDPLLTPVIAPAIIALPEGADCNPFLRRRPSPSKLFRIKFWNSTFYLMWLKQFLSPYVRMLRYRLALPTTMQTGPQPSLIYAPHGAFLIFGRSYFERGGFIDDGFFLYGEEFSVAEICRRHGLSVIHDPELRVIHDAHKVTGRLCTRETFEYGKQGLDYVLRTYFYPSAKTSPSTSVGSTSDVPSRPQSAALRRE